MDKATIEALVMELYKNEEVAIKVCALLNSGAYSLEG